jgi:hypothetical protein
MAIYIITCKFEHNLDGFDWASHGITNGQQPTY